MGEQLSVTMLQDELQTLNAHKSRKATMGRTLINGGILESMESFRTVDTALSGSSGHSSMSSLSIHSAFNIDTVAAEAIKILQSRQKDPVFDPAMAMVVTTRKKKDKKKDKKSKKSKRDRPHRRSKSLEFKDVDGSDFLTGKYKSDFRPTRSSDDPQPPVMERQKSKEFEDILDRRLSYWHLNDLSSNSFLDMLNTSKKSGFHDGIQVQRTNSTSFGVIQEYATGATTTTDANSPKTGSKQDANVTSQCDDNAMPMMGPAPRRKSMEFEDLCGERAGERRLSYGSSNGINIGQRSQDFFLVDEVETIMEEPDQAQPRPIERKRSKQARRKSLEYEDIQESERGFGTFGFDTSITPDDSNRFKNSTKHSFNGKIPTHPGLSYRRDDMDDLNSGATHQRLSLHKSRGTQHSMWQESTVRPQGDCSARIRGDRSELVIRLSEKSPNNKLMERVNTRPSMTRSLAIHTLESAESPTRNASHVTTRSSLSRHDSDPSIGSKASAPLRRTDESPGSESHTNPTRRLLYRRESEKSIGSKNRLGFSRPDNSDGVRRGFFKREVEKVEPQCPTDGSVGSRGRRSLSRPRNETATRGRTKSIDDVGSAMTKSRSPIRLRRSMSEYGTLGQQVSAQEGVSMVPRLSPYHNDQSSGLKSSPIESNQSPFHLSSRDDNDPSVGTKISSPVLKTEESTPNISKKPARRFLSRRESERSLGSRHMLGFSRPENSDGVRRGFFKREVEKVEPLRSRCATDESVGSKDHHSLSHPVNQADQQVLTKSTNPRVKLSRSLSEYGTLGHQVSHRDILAETSKSEEFTSTKKYSPTVVGADTHLSYSDRVMKGTIGIKGKSPSVSPPNQVYM